MLDHSTLYTFEVGSKLGNSVHSTAISPFVVRPPRFKYVVTSSLILQDGDNFDQAQSSRAVSRIASLSPSMKFLNIS